MISVSRDIFILLALIILNSCYQNREIELFDLRCEYRVNPIGIDVDKPRFSWKIYSLRRGVNQVGYRIIVSSTKDLLSKEIGDAWDSGVIESNETVNIEYDGSPLKSNEQYFWKIYFWSNSDEKVVSNIASFHMGQLKLSDWLGNWIVTKEETIDASPLLRKEFLLNKDIESAYAYVSSLGFNEFYLNGEKVGDHVLDPAITDGRKTVLYSTFDVTEYLNKGENVAGAVLGNGGWNLRKGKDRYSWGGLKQMGDPSFYMQINITYKDHSQDVIVTDDSWRYSYGPITYNNIYGGEDYDARKEIEDWNTTNYNDSSWQDVKFNHEVKGILKSQQLPPIKVIDTIQPITEIKSDKGIYLFDLGQNIAGWWRIKVKGKEGQKVKVRGSETLNDFTFPKKLQRGDYISNKIRYHTQSWTEYTLKGSEEEIYEPHFFYTGFRYIEVSLQNEEDLEILRVDGRVVSSDLKRNGTFLSSDSILNQIHQLSLWSQRANNIGYPTDCPHREKGAYNGDGQLIAETAMHDFHMATFYTKWVNDMRDAQEDNGRIPNTSPTLVGGMGGGVAWGSAYILVPYWMYSYYKDRRILEEHYPTMKKYIGYLSNLAKEDENPDESYIINYFGGFWYSLGEWCAPHFRHGPNHDVVNTFYYYYDAKLMSEIAGILGKQEDAKVYSRLSKTIKDEFNNKFFNREKFIYGTDSIYQTYQLLALQGDIVPKEFRKDVLETIVIDIESRNGHLNTGIIGTKYLWPILTQEGFGNLAFTVATKKDFPSYGYWIKNNSTTLLEQWSGEKSHNHQTFGSIVEYFYKYLAGIQSPSEGNTTIGYKNIYLRPFMPDSLKMVDATIETIAGKVSSKWTKNGGSYNYVVSIPANTTATVVLPIPKFKNVRLLEDGVIIWESGQPKVEVFGIGDIQSSLENILLKIESGKYHFTAETLN